MNAVPMLQACAKHQLDETANDPRIWAVLHHWFDVEIAGHDEALRGPNLLLRPDRREREYRLVLTLKAG